MQYSAIGEGIQYHETEEPQDGRGAEEEIGDEAPSGGPRWSQEDIVCKLYGDL